MSERKTHSCKYWEDINNNSSIYCKTKNWLPAVFNEELKPIFTCLTNDELLIGLTQNQNKSINNILLESKNQMLWC